MSFLFDPGVFGLSGEVLPGTTFSWYEAGTSTPLQTYTTADLITTNSNPVVVPANGRLPAMWLLDRDYKAIVGLPSGQSFTIPLVRGPVPGTPFTTRAALAAAPVIDGAAYTLTEAGREGTFICRAGALAVSDPEEGLYIVSDTAGYYYERLWDGVNGKPEWFGAVTNGPDCLTALQACVLLCPVTLLEQADYWVSDTWVINTSWRQVKARGFITYNSGEGTRIILAHWQQDDYPRWSRDQSRRQSGGHVHAAGSA